jgi:hypothetical protein
MSTLNRWWARVAAACAGVALALVVPALAWAGGSPMVVAGEVARRRPRLGFFGGLSALCCLAVVTIVVLAILMIMRNRRSRGPGR